MRMEFQLIFIRNSSGCIYENYSMVSILFRKGGENIILLIQQLLLGHNRSFPLHLCRDHLSENSFQFLMIIEKFRH